MLENIETRPSHEPVSDRFQIWSGKSGRRYVHNVYDADRCPKVDDAIYLAVGRARDGSRRPLAIEGAAAFASAVRMDNGRRAWPGNGRVDEVHVHLLASTRKSIEKVIEDLRAAHDLSKV